MFLLVTGASGAGKSTVCRAAARELAPEVECVELHDIVGVPACPDIAWRQRATEAVVQRALELQAEGRHLLLSGDPVAAGEVLSALSAVGLDGVAVCLLDVSPRRAKPRSTNGWEAMRWDRWSGIDPIIATGELRYSTPRS